jgi:hypothetical protein
MRHYLLPTGRMTHVNNPNVMCTSLMLAYQLPSVLTSCATTKRGIAADIKGAEQESVQRSVCYIDRVYMQRNGSEIR